MEDPTFIDALKKVEDVSDCIQRLAASGDPEALAQADQLLKKLDSMDDLKTKSDRTLISKAAPQQDPTAQQDAFLREIERDAAERAERREANRKRAAVWKDRGNEHFKLANYAKAVECYSKGLEISKDFELLYQNRANCYVKQGRFNEALADAEAAIFLTQERSAKPFFHQAKALTGLDRFDEARAAYGRMAACSDAAPGHADRCSAELDRLTAAKADEAKALAAFNDASVGTGQQQGAAIDMLIYRLARGDQPLSYYAAGMRMLAFAVSSSSEEEGSASARALFRAKSGFSLLGKQRAVLAALETPLAGMSVEQSDLLASAIFLCSAVAEGDPENCHRCVRDLPALLARATEVVQAGPAVAAATAIVRQAALDALWQISAHACEPLCSRNSQDPAALLAALAYHVQKQPVKMAESAARLLDRFSVCHRLRERIQRAPTEKLAAFAASVESLVASGASESLVAFADAIQAVRRLFANCQTVRTTAASKRNFLAACEAAVAKYSAADDAGESGEAIDELQQLAASSVLGLLVSVSLEATPAVSAHSPALADLAVRIAVSPSSSADARLFALAMLATITPREPAVAVRVASDPRSLGLLAGILASPGHPGVASALRTLAAALGAHADARRSVGDDPRWLDRLLELAHSPSDCCLGNATLCLARCLEDTAAAEILARTDIIRLLLCRMRDCKDREAKANCAVLCGKLAQSHHGHRERLRELDGINILNSVLVSNNIRL